MPINYNKSARVALKLLRGNGRPVQMVKVSTAPANPAKAWEGPAPSADTNVTVTAVFVDPVSEKDLGREVQLGPGNNLKHGLQICFFAALENPGVDFTEFNRMIDHGLTYTIVELHQLSPGSTSIMWEARVRR